MNDITNEPLSPDEERELDAIEAFGKGVVSKINADLRVSAAQLAMFPELVDALSAAHDRAQDGNYSGSAQKHIYSLLERARRLLERQA